MPVQIILLAKGPNSSRHIASLREFVTSLPVNSPTCKESGITEESMLDDDL